MKPFRWKNCYADVQASKHDITIVSFLNDVILPAIRTLEEKIAELSNSEDASAAFATSDTEDLLRETKMAFCLAVQSIWERQIRNYLRGCAEELRPGAGLSAKIEKANWTALCVYFKDLRDIDLEAFPSYAELKTLHLLGNASRHGDGASAIELAKRCADLWPSGASPDLQEPNAVPPSVVTMDVPVTRIQAFVAAVAAFWNDAEYIYNESIERKHPSLEIRLARERVERIWRPQARTADGS